MSSDSDPPGQDGSDYQQDVYFDKPGIVGARWWHRALIERDRLVSRRDAIGAMAKGGLALLGLGMMGTMLSNCGDDDGPEASLADRDALHLQKTYGWDFGARGTPLVFDGQAQGPFVRAELAKLPAVMTPLPGPFAKYHIPTLAEALAAVPASTLPDPRDGKPRPDAGTFQKLSDVLMPISTAAMTHAYGAGASLARMSYGHPGLAVLADLPGPLAVAFAAGAASLFEPVLLLDNWPHPLGVVPSHLTLAAMAYYQPRFASQKQRQHPPPLFVLDRTRLAAYTEASDRFDNRYYARFPKLAALAKDGVKTLLYVVESPAALPEPDDLHEVLTEFQGADPMVKRVVTLSEFVTDGRDPNYYYGGSGAAEDAFWAPGAAKQYPTAFVRRRLPLVSPPIGKVPVMITATGIILAAALDRRGSMNRFASGGGSGGGWGSWGG